MKTTNNLNQHKVSGSYKDSSGHVFFHDGIYYRQINKAYQSHYDRLINSGLYEKLTSLSLLIPHHEVNFVTNDLLAYKFIKPQQMPFISYPYEWSFSQLKDAALLTLEIQKIALTYKMILKDASAFNIQFLQGKPVLIDTLSFEIYKPGQAWTAYKQFCEHFLVPLTLAVYKNSQLLKLLSVFIDGIPLVLATKIIPFHAYLKVPLFFHIFMHSLSQKQFKGEVNKATKANVSQMGLLGIIDNLHYAVQSLRNKQIKTTWSDYYDTSNYTKSSFNDKKRLLTAFLNICKPNKILDIGANTGEFSLLAAKKDIDVIAVDSDSQVINQLYNHCKKNNITNVLPLCIDITNPTPGIGWQNTERLSFLNRVPKHTVFALALIHHLFVTYNLPFDYLCDFFQQISKWLIIEFVPKTDPQFQKLIGLRTDDFSNYSQENFEKSFKKYFTIEKIKPIRDTKRLLYLMKKK